MAIAATIFFRVLVEILVLDLDLQDKAMVFSPFPPSDRSRGSEACPRDGIAAVAPNSAMMRIRFSISPHSARIFSETPDLYLAKGTTTM